MRAAGGGSGRLSLSLLTQSPTPALCPRRSFNRCLNCSDELEDMLPDELTDDQLDQVLMAEMSEV